MVQPNAIYGNSIYFPYAAGSLIAYAFNDPIISENCSFKGFIYKKSNINEVVQNLDSPFLVGFSCYVWNYEYNKRLAKKIKELFPHCITVFGGHQVCKNSDVLKEDFVDYCIFGEGEENFKSLILSLITNEDINSIPNLSYKDKEGIRFTKTKRMEIPERVSPYLNGYFDSLIENETLLFSAILETNRGCPNKCAFCDWGNEKAHVKIFDADLVKAEIDWMARNKIEYCYCADANFGMFKRDMEFVDYLIKANSETSYPQKFQATYSKNDSKTVFEITQKLNKVGMSKGATLSFQSMHQHVLNEIYRKNMPIESFHELMSLYSKNGISTYSELIIGLPGETYESFKNGIEQLLQCGQHMSINFFNCELLVNSIMSDPEYIKAHKIEYCTTEQHQYHVVPPDNEIPEISRIVVSTSSMPKDKWIESNILSVFVRAFHNLGLLQCIAIYLYFEKHIKYTDFYADLINWAKANESTVCGKVYRWLEEKYKEILKNSGSLTCVEPEYGNLTWPLDEGAFLKVVLELQKFYDETEEFIKSYFDNKKLFSQLLLYQKSVLKTPYSKGCQLNLEYDFYKYFINVYKNSYSPLEPLVNTLLIDSSDTPDDLAEYAKKVIWFGRKGGQNIIKEIKYI